MVDKLTSALPNNVINITYLHTQGAGPPLTFSQSRFQEQARHLMIWAFEPVRPAYGCQFIQPSPICTPGSFLQPISECKATPSYHLRALCRGLHRALAAF